MRRRDEADAMVHLALYDRPVSAAETRALFLRHVLACIDDERTQGITDLLLSLLEKTRALTKDKPLKQIAGPVAKQLLEEYARDAYIDKTGTEPSRSTFWPKCLAYEATRLYPEALITEIGWELGTLVAEASERGSN